MGRRSALLVLVTLVIAGCGIGTADSKTSAARKHQVLAADIRLTALQRRAEQRSDGTRLAAAKVDGTSATAAWSGSQIHPDLDSLKFLLIVAQGMGAGHWWSVHCSASEISVRGFKQYSHWVADVDLVAVEGRASVAVDLGAGDTNRGEVGAARDRHDVGEVSATCPKQTRLLAGLTSAAIIG